MKSIPPRPDPVCRQPRPVAWLAAALLLVASGAQAGEVWLTTYGPGAEVWERFGHNGLWLHDPSRDIDRIYSFGYFDMAAPGFYTGYAYGVMTYEAMAVSSAREFAWYRQRDRSIRLQRLDLSAGQFNRLHQWLEQAVAPDAAGYDYDYYLNNCSTRIRDLLDRVTGGALAQTFLDTPARQNFRAHTHRLTQQRLWLHTGIMMALGPMVDRPRSAWEEMFLPSALADRVGELEIDGRPLVIEDRVVYDPGVHQPPDEPGTRWAAYLILGLATAALVAIPRRLRPRSHLAGLPTGVWILAATLAGAVLIFLWRFTAHAAAGGNWLVLLFNPVWLLLLLPLPGGVRRGLVLLLAVATTLGAVLLAWPGGVQYRPGLLMWIVPAHGIVLWDHWTRSRKRIDSGPG